MDYDNYDGHKHEMRIVKNMSWHQWFDEILKEIEGCVSLNPISKIPIVMVTLTLLNLHLLDQVMVTLKPLIYTYLIKVSIT
ncbi:hypothetical protein Syun_027322 [Stephania yunnanensis]|uniref:Uncharacterized protein n=1 Tax=Stephania yunnanensis TaxID=152371 RepID=A0AAP0EFF9_9MAGN